MYSSPNISQVIESRGMTLVGHVRHMVERTGTEFWWRNLKENERKHLEDLRVDGWTIVKWMLNFLVERLWTGFIWLRIRIRMSGMLFLRQ